MLLSGDAAALDAALSGGAAADKPLVGPATAGDWEAKAKVAATHGCALIVAAEGGDLDALAQVSQQVSGAGVEDQVFDPGAATLAGDLAAFTRCAASPSKRTSARSVTRSTPRRARARRSASSRAPRRRSPSTPA